MNKFLGVLDTTRIIVCTNDVLQALDITATVCNDLKMEGQISIINCDGNSIEKIYTRYFSDDIESKHPFLIISPTLKIKQATTSLAAILKGLP